MQSGFTHPWFLWLLLFVPLVWIVPARLQDWRHGVLRSLLLALIVLALSRPVLYLPSAQQCFVFVVDQSESLSPEQRQAALSLAATLRSQLATDDRASTVVFGELIASAAAKADRERSNLIDASTSSIGHALDAASLQIPVGCHGTIALISDGAATDRSWSEALQSAIRRGIRVHVHDLGRRDDDVHVAAVSPLGTLRLGQTAEVTVDVVGNARELQIRLSDEQGELARSSSFGTRGRSRVAVQFEPRAAGFTKLTAEILIADGADRDRSNNSLATVLAIQEPRRVLYLGERQSNVVRRLSELLGNGFAIEVPAAALDERFPLSRYDLVMLDDRPAASLPTAFQSHLLRSIHQEGLGLFYSGGRAAFGAGGFHDSVVAQALPIELTQQEETQEPSVAVAVVLDSSGSMRGTPLELAKQVTRLALRRLKSQDKLGIVEFYGAKTWAVPLQSAGNRIEIDRAIARMQADGATVLYPAIEEAYYGLKGMHTRYKHIVVITDAGVEDAGFEELIRRAARDGINLSTVLVGEERYNTLLFNMARWGQGRFYSVGDPFNLVELDFNSPSRTPQSEYQTGSFALTARGGPGWWGDVDVSRLPPLSGYAQVKTRQPGEVLIAERAGDHPVLTTWHYGLGRVSAFMTEPVGQGTAAWREWHGYGAMLARVLSRTASDYDAFAFEISRQDDAVTVQARRLSRDSTLLPGGISVEGGTPLQFRQLAPDLFESIQWADPTRPVRLRVGIAGSPAFEHRLVSPAQADRSPETQPDPSYAVDLERIAQVTGGARIVADSPQLVDGKPRVAQSLLIRHGAPWLLLLALIVYLAELIYRRR